MGWGSADSFDTPEDKPEVGPQGSPGLAWKNDSSANWAVFMLQEVLRTIHATMRYRVGQICTAFTVLRDADIPGELRGTTIPRCKMKFSLGIRPKKKK